MAIRSLITIGSTAIPVDIQCHLSNNIPNIVIVGFANKTVDEARERLRGAFASSKIELPRKRIIINLAPADIPKADSGFDIAIAVAILLANNAHFNERMEKAIYIGELGLDGTTRAVRGLIGKLMVGRKLGYTEFYIPASNLEQARLVPDLQIYPVKTLQQLFQHLSGEKIISPVHTSYNPKEEKLMSHNVTSHNNYITFSQISGQSQSKRALEIAAAGGHNILLTGPPGTGKSMLAKALPSILPDMTLDEILQVTHLHSLASHDYEQIVTERPFRSPHHSTSHTAVVGGGSNLKPGEISLAHHGILFFDEFPEFGRQTLEALRQPLEDRQISVSRVRSSATYPASFILVATANPCPCGFYGHTNAGSCRCLPQQIVRYQQKLSGPIIDRIDLHTSVHEVDHQTLLTKEVNHGEDMAVRKRVEQARKLQQQRHPGILNAELTNQQLKQFGKITSQAKQLLDTAAGRLHLSARSYMRALKVARTIADLEDSANLSPAHISEALAYRPQIVSPV